MCHYLCNACFEYQVCLPVSGCGHMLHLQPSSCILLAAGLLLVALHLSTRAGMRRTLSDTLAATAAGCMHCDVCPAHVKVHRCYALIRCDSGQKKSLAYREHTSRDCSPQADGRLGCRLARLLHKVLVLVGVHIGLVCVLRAELLLCQWVFPDLGNWCPGVGSKRLLPGLEPLPSDGWHIGNLPLEVVPAYTALPMVYVVSITV